MAMTYHELVEKVRIALAVKTDASKVEEHIAAQVNVTGEAAGAFYIEIKDGMPYVEPYTYNDRDFLLTCDGAEILAVAQGKKTLESAIVEGAVAHEGNWDKTLVLSNIIPAAPAEKPAKKAVKAKKEETVAEEPAKEEEPAEGQLTFAEEDPKTDDVKAEEPKTEEAAPKKSRGRKPKAETAKTEKPAKKTTKKTADK